MIKVANLQGNLSSRHRQESEVLPLVFPFNTSVTSDPRLLQEVGDLGEAIAYGGA
ncbi:MAG: hypothetical protein V7K54_29390 [Nostoc sp.]